MSAVNVVAELQDLAWSRPSADATPAVVAARYVHKAQVVEQLAAEGSPLAERQAEATYHHAHCLLAATPAQGENAHAAPCPECRRIEKQHKKTKER